MSDGGTLLGSAEFWNVAVTKVACKLCVSFGAEASPRRTPELSGGCTGPVLHYPVPVLSAHPIPACG